MEKNHIKNYLERNIIERKLLELDSKLVKRTKIAVITGYGSQKVHFANNGKTTFL